MTENERGKFYTREEKWTCYNRLMNGNEVCVRFSGTTDISFFSKEWWDSPFKGKSQS